MKFNKVLLLCLLAFTFSFNLFSQVFDPVKWETKVEKISDTEYNLISIATIDSGWHLYSQNVPDNGPIPTTFSYTETKDFELIGKTSEEEGETIDDPVFQMRIKFFGNKAAFSQRIKVLNKELSLIEGEVEFMVCDDEKCLPPTYIDLKFNLKDTEDVKEVSTGMALNLTGNTPKILEPVKWSTSVEKINDTELILVSTATIDKGWKLYAQNIEEGGPIPTSFDYTLKDGVELVGSTNEEKGEESIDKVFDMKIKYFKDKAEFRQKIKVSDATISSLVSEVGFMSCDDTQCTAPTYVDLEYDLTKTVVASSDISENSEADDDESSKGLWSIFIIAFFSGFVALLTPCVFPMIPMTVSFFIKQSQSKAKGIRNAIIYGLSIIVIYVLLGTIITAIFGADALNALATNVWFNLIFFILLVVFAISFLGAFEIVLPNSWANKADKQADRGGLVGIFFMALALAIVSFSCTGPIVGTILVEAASKGGIAPVIGMLGFSSAIALPFALFAAFPGWLNSLPKSGGWLNTVKVVLGFLELALAFKFLSQADLVLQLHFLEREVFIAIWIAIFGTLSLYLFGKIQLPHDSPLKHISVGRLLFGLLTLTFTIYMIPGLWGAPLKIISAFPPPLDYSESPYGVGNSRGGGASITDIPEGAHLLAPHDILAFNDYETGLAYAKKVGKPVMLDFTGWACVNCRKMEQNVWVDPQVLSKLKNDIVLISLYVDEQIDFPEGEAPDSKLRPGKKLRNKGQKWSEMQTIKYKTNTQPYYVLMDHNEENLIEPVAYTPDIEEYEAWLKEGIGNFKD
ncbi:Cytochrome c-type biogenesis protein DsbD, protein-disulfide reductase [Winogradskyella psychrotolerans RS-3]|uniref:Cytochrome c-type biogenesis protein DsbD, protein-disulfide reductase n=1 Tax=Winogradskyella psychrotolerans RS-3 TaxID=641526 RepID=S7XD34_9FLAO|nr:protein-disulfide reductase DsbD domain-containing protein [Winogradskyella psychrotolerans]EPR73918.1 Cytochrome c-type biogenesis protein DsbD, protein-disulfide reductase [Winogradskyella psychrotolerans RS-3]